MKNDSDFDKNATMIFVIAIVVTTGAIGLGVYWADKQLNTPDF